MDEIVVVGGGLLGCAVAWELAKAGARVEVLERAVPGAEASSAAAGILAPRMEAHGREPMRATGIESLGMYPGWVAELGADVGFRVCGLVTAYADAPDRDALRLADVREADPLLAGGPGWWLPEEGVVDPRRLVTAVHAAAARAGVRFRTGVEVSRVEADAVVLADGHIARGRVVVCAGAWTGKVPGLARLPVRPVRGQILALEGAAPRGVVFGAGGYLVPRGDRVICGATAEEVGFERGVTAGGILQILTSAVTMAPGLAGARFVEAWSGFRPGTPDDLPILGEVDGVWVASGHFRNGILLAPVTARWMADALLEGAPLPAAFGPGRFAG
ncbi:MAG: FAD-dependent oxidoreductase [Myxococcota bacterium]